MEIRSLRDLGKQVRQRRRAVGLPAKEAAELAGVSRRLLLELEQGTRSNVGFSKVLQVLTLLGFRMELKLRGLPTDEARDE
jgi:transcriptional regulator with XRE-family HTH domain